MKTPQAPHGDPGDATGVSAEQSEATALLNQLVEDVAPVAGAVAEWSAAGRSGLLSASNGR